MKLHNWYCHKQRGLYSALELQMEIFSFGLLIVTCFHEIFFSVLLLYIFKKVFIIIILFSSYEQPIRIWNIHLETFFNIFGNIFNCPYLKIWRCKSKSYLNDIIMNNKKLVISFYLIWLFRCFTVLFFYWMQLHLLIWFDEKILISLL